MPTLFRGSLRRLWLLTLPVMLLCSSCVSTRYFNQRAMFRLTDSQGRQLDSTKLRIAVNRTERNYLIQPNDKVEVRVNTNKGERILDPNGELKFGQGGGGNSGSGNNTDGAEFLVQADGTVVLPLINRVKITGLSLIQADSVLKIRYNEYYKEPFVMTRVTNNRVVVLGAGGQVIPLTNDNMNLLEVLALAGGIDGGSGSGGGLYRYGGKASNIRIIRGDLKNPRVQQIDLTTLDGMRRANLQVEPNDIIYVEPIRRPVLETLSDAAPVIGFVTLLFNTTLIIINFTK